MFLVSHGSTKQPRYATFPHTASPLIYVHRSVILGSKRSPGAGSSLYQVNSCLIASVYHPGHLVITPSADKPQYTCQWPGIAQKINTATAFRFRVAGIRHGMASNHRDLLQSFRKLYFLWTGRGKVLDLRAKRKYTCFP